MAPSRRPRRDLVLLSGGVDSAVALWLAVEAGRDVVALTLHYPERPAREVEATQALAARAGVRLVEADLPFLREAQARGASIAPPMGYVAARNATMYAVAVHVADGLARETIVGGHNADDAARFPDAAAGWLARLDALLREGLWAGDGRATPALEFPLLSMPKPRVLQEAARLGVPLDLTWSCYEDGASPCGACPACASSHASARGVA
ncbi:MAG TPA: 7-cyano-7-deazaguanine synthase [Candidatus Thermoplasmatota archaeon]|nr:7-cyano-7-deazaguanine synthase [Candidatus Thermoplasmatota archaeon]